jgi:hypothetical protein
MAGVRGNYRKLTAAQRAEAEEAVYGLLLNRTTKGVIKRFMRAVYGLPARSVERILSRARGRLLAELGKPRAELVADAYGVLLSVIQSDAGPRLKLRANRMLIWLFGLNAPKPARVTPRPLPACGEYGREIVRRASATPEGRDALCRLAEAMGGADAGADPLPPGAAGEAGPAAGDGDAPELPDQPVGLASADPLPCGLRELTEGEIQGA